MYNIGIKEQRGLLVVELIQYCNPMVIYHFNRLGFKLSKVRKRMGNNQITLKHYFVLSVHR